MTMPMMRPKRKNPILRTRQMNLPPGARGRVALGLTAAAAEGRFELQTCADCACCCRVRNALLGGGEVGGLSRSVGKGTEGNGHQAAPRPSVYL